MLTTRLSASDLHGERFDRTPLGRRGYDPDQVDDFVRQVRAELLRRDREHAALTESHTAFAQENAQLHKKLGLLDANSLAEDINTEAIEILNSARCEAERCYAEAEDQAQHLNREARGHCENILGHAQQQAQAILDDAHRHATAAGNMAATAYRAASTAENYRAHQEELEARIAYMQSYEAAWRTNFRALLATLSQQIDQWPPEAPPQDVSTRSPTH